MELKFDPISSANGGVRDVAVDFTAALEAAELLSDALANSSDISALVVSDVNVNVQEIDKDNGDVIAIGKGVQLKLTTQAPYYERELFVDIEITGNSNTADTYSVIVPITDKIRR